MTDHLPHSIDRMPINLRDKRAGPILDPEEAIAIGLLQALGAKFDPDGKEVEAIMESIKRSGYEIGCGREEVDMVHRTSESAEAIIGHPAAEKASPDWLEGLTYRDWLFDGHPIRSEYHIDRFNHLDWSRAWLDLGPSVAGNLGPYWHVPIDDGDTVHRLYPKVLQSKWLLLIRQACEEYAERQVRLSKEGK